MAKNQAHPESEIALFVRAARKALKLTQEQFGDKFNRTKANANAWELGRHEPAFSLLKVMSFESGVPLPASIKSDLNGLDTDAVQSKPHTNEALISNLQDWRLQASSKSQEVIDNLTLLAKKNKLRDEDWQLIDQMVHRFMNR